MSELCNGLSEGVENARNYYQLLVVEEWVHKGLIDAASRCLGQIEYRAGVSYALSLSHDESLVELHISNSKKHLIRRGSGSNIKSLSSRLIFSFPHRTEEQAFIRQLYHVIMQKIGSCELIYSYNSFEEHGFPKVEISIQIGIA